MPGALRPGADRRALAAEVARALEGLAGGSRVVLGLSGGPDSTGLALLARAARPDLGLTAVHVRHGLRDDAADAAVAAQTAAALGLALVVRPVAVEPAGEGPEAAARAARHAALAAVAAELGASAVLLGHTADDQAETVLLALGRGTGTRGLGGMRAWREGQGCAVVRPLLRLRRADVRAAVEQAGLAVVTDPTNRDPAQRRARVRSAVLPALATLSGDRGDPVALLTRLADLARDDADLLDELAGAEAERLLRRWGPAWVLPAAPVRALHPALARRVVRRLLAAARGGEQEHTGATAITGLDAAAVDRVRALPPGGQAEVAGGVRVTADAHWLVAVPAAPPDLATRELSVPGTLALPELRLTLTAALAPGGPAPAGSPAPAPAPAPAVTSLSVLPPRARPPRGAGAGAAVVLGPEAAAGLLVRARRPADRTPGAARRLSDRLTDLGVPRALRGLVPVVAAAAAPDEPLWVPGVAVADPASGAVAVRLS